MYYKEWLNDWSRELEQATAAGSVGQTQVRKLHQWLWNTWSKNGNDLSRQMNEALGIGSSSALQPDTPHLFAGQVEQADILLVNINPGWKKEKNVIEDEIVNKSEEAAWDFSRSLFTRYPEKVGPMYWWNHAIGLARRILHVVEPARTTPSIKREWANEHVAGWELFPIHSSRADFQKVIRNEGSPELKRSIASSIQLAVELRRPITILSSKIGAELIDSTAAAKKWQHIGRSSSPLPPTWNAYRIRNQVILSIPRQLVSRHSGFKFSDISSWIHSLRR